MDSGNQRNEQAVVCCDSLPPQQMPDARRPSLFDSTLTRAFLLAVCAARKTWLDFEISKVSTLNVPTPPSRVSIRGTKLWGDLPRATFGREERMPSPDKSITAAPSSATITA